MTVVSSSHGSLAAVLGWGIGLVIAGAAVVIAAPAFLADYRGAARNYYQWDTFFAATSAASSAAAVSNLAAAAELINSGVDYVGPTRAAMSLYWAMNDGG